MDSDRASLLLASQKKYLSQDSGSGTGEPRYQVWYIFDLENAFLDRMNRHGLTYSAYLFPWAERVASKSELSLTTSSKRQVEIHFRGINMI